MAIIPVADLDDKVVDYTIEPDSGGGSFVPQSFVLAGTLPIRINGGASADMSTSPDTISVNTFGAAAAGIVPLSGGGTTNFLRADGTWASPAGSGGYTTVQEEGVDLTQRGKLNIIGTDVAATDNAGSSRTDLTIPRFTSLIGGTVPASGGGTTNFLRADGTWASTIASAGAVTLQPTTPGTADVGHWHVSGVGFADTRLVAGPVVTPAATAKIEAYTQDSTNGFLGRASGTGGSAAITLQRSRGTLAAPTATQDVDTLGSWTASGYSSSGGWTGSIEAGMTVRADGNASATRQPSLTDIIGGDAGNFTYARMTGAGMLLESGAGSISTPIRTNSTLQIKGSTSLKTEAKSAGFTAGSAVRYLLDTSGGTFNITLPSAAGLSGRFYEFVHVTGTVAAIVNSTVSGISSFPVFPGDRVQVASDDTNWFINGDLAHPLRGMTLSNSSAVASTTTKTDFDTSITLPANTLFRYPALMVVRAKGTCDVSGGGTIQLFIRDLSTPQDFASIKAITPTVISSQEWTIQYAFGMKPASSQGFSLGGIATFSASSGADTIVAVREASTLMTPTAALGIGVAVKFSVSSASNTATLNHVAVSFHGNGAVSA